MIDRFKPHGNIAEIKNRVAGEFPLDEKSAYDRLRTSPLVCRRVEETYGLLPDCGFCVVSGCRSFAYQFNGEMRVSEEWSGGEYQGAEIVERRGDAYVLRVGNYVDLLKALPNTIFAKLSVIVDTPEGPRGKLSPAANVTYLPHGEYLHDFRDCAELVRGQEIDGEKAREMLAASPHVKVRDVGYSAYGLMLNKGFAVVNESDGVATIVNNHDGRFTLWTADAEKLKKALRVTEFGGKRGPWE